MNSHTNLKNPKELKKEIARTEAATLWLFGEGCIFKYWSPEYVQPLRCRCSIKPILDRLDNDTWIKTIAGLYKLKDNSGDKCKKCGEKGEYTEHGYCYPCLMR